ncbi:hypothetical protein K7432_017364 [Basidiobolus ranarum]|uniref:Uncharacterized protein n=1 Tax=Basidiobolus ranarum TaxID=34480 RepID=A0ABR2WDG9_9FUNG
MSVKTNGTLSYARLLTKTEHQRVMNVINMNSTADVEFKAFSTSCEKGAQAFTKCTVDLVLYDTTFPNNEICVLIRNDSSQDTLRYELDLRPENKAVIETITPTPDATTGTSITVVPTQPSSANSLLPEFQSIFTALVVTNILCFII